MSQPQGWSENQARRVGERIKRFRGRRSAQWLADRCTELGYPVSRSAIAKLENGRREDIGLSELEIFAAALEVAPALLIFPIDTDDPVQILPGQAMNPWTAYQCFIGEYVLSRAAGSPGASPAERQILRDTPMWVPRLPGRDDPIAIYRQHNSALTDYLTTREHDPALAERHLTMLAAARIGMHRHGWALPQIPPEVAEAVAEPLLAWGYKQEQSGDLVEGRSVQDLAPAADHVGQTDE
ncbi:MAG: helix-turn-helix domain-containing protein [Pseudonocardiaceae bacterium]